MKQMFFLLFLIVFMYSCEDELNSPNNDSIPSLGCTDKFATCNRDFDANVDDGSCIYENDECVHFKQCAYEDWSHHTCINPEDDSSATNWSGHRETCEALGYIYTAGSCNVSSDGGSNE